MSKWVIRVGLTGRKPLPLYPQQTDILTLGRRNNSPEGYAKDLVVFPMTRDVDTLCRIFGDLVPQCPHRDAKQALKRTTDPSRASRYVRKGSWLRENVCARKVRRMVFSIVFSRQPSPALLFFKLIEVETKFLFANSISEFSRSQDPNATLARQHLSDAEPLRHGTTADQCCRAADSLRCCAFSIRLLTTRFGD